jgi:hypothetical protein
VGRNLYVIYSDKQMRVEKVYINWDFTFVPKIIVSLK